MHPFGCWFLRMLADYFYNRCYRAPVRASMSLSPSKLQTRSTGPVLTSRNSHSMRFPVTAIIESASFSEINVKRVYVYSLPPTMGFRASLYGVSFSSESAFSKINTCRGMAKETLKKIVSPEGKAILTFTMCLGSWGFFFNEKTTLFRVVFVF